eukprot:gene338-616_t
MGAYEREMDLYEKEAAEKAAAAKAVKVMVEVVMKAMAEVAMKVLVEVATEAMAEVAMKAMVEVAIKDGSALRNISGSRIYIASTLQDETIERCFIPKDQMHMISSCSKFVEQSRHRFLLRPKCPSCHLDINANSIQEDPNSCMVLKCTRCCNVFCGFCLTYSHKVAEVYYHAVQWCRQNPSRPLARLPPSISVQEHFERLILSRMNERSVYERPSPDVGGSVKMGNKEMVRSDIDSVSAQT